MSDFYQQALRIFVFLVVLSVFVAFLGYSASKNIVPLTPGSASPIPWASSIEPKQPLEKTALWVKNEGDVVEYDFKLDKDDPFPYAAFGFWFSQPNGEATSVDFSPYQEVTFQVSCEPANVLQFVLYTHEPEVTVTGDLDTYRISSAYFSCEKSWRTVAIHLHELQPQEWWMNKYQISLAQRAYRLDNAYEIRFLNSPKSPRSEISNVKVTQVSLVGEKHITIWIAIVVITLLWAGYWVWVTRQYVAMQIKLVKKKVTQDRPLIAYKTLSIDPQKDKNKAAVLKLMATEYMNPDLDLEYAVNQLGINRNKINEILKKELGFTFSGYLNKLRLTESARLLSTSASSNVSEIAFHVGYNNASYFSRLFKAEYGCTPKAFKSMYHQSGDDTP